jgi:hypothetical protein
MKDWKIIVKDWKRLEKEARIERKKRFQWHKLEYFKNWQVWTHKLKHFNHGIESKPRLTNFGPTNSCTQSMKDQKVIVKD